MYLASKSQIMYEMKVAIVCMILICPTAHFLIWKSNSMIMMMEKKYFLYLRVLKPCCELFWNGLI